MRASQKFDNEVWRQKRREVLPESLSSWYNSENGIIQPPLMVLHVV